MEDSKLRIAIVNKEKCKPLFQAKLPAADFDFSQFIPTIVAGFSVN